MQVDPPPGVLVEVVLLRLVDTAAGDACSGSALAYRTVRAPLGAGVPDEVARSLSGPPTEVLHSTSWRHEPGTGVVLTYVALPDPDPGAPAVRLVEPSVVSSGDPLRPQPDLLHAPHVVAHAVRHLVELAGRDPAVRTAAALPARRRTWTVMAAEAARMPTATHAQAHAQARASG